MGSLFFQKGPLPAEWDTSSGVVGWGWFFFAQSCGLITHYFFSVHILKFQYTGCPTLSGYYSGSQ